MGPSKNVFDGGPHRPVGRGNFEGEGMPRHVRRHSDVNCAKTDEPLEMPFGLWTWVDRRKHKFSRIRHVGPGCPRERQIDAIWQIRLNRPSAAVNAVVCQVTLTICYCCCYVLL